MRIQNSTTRDRYLKAIQLDVHRDPSPLKERIKSNSVQTVILSAGGCPTWSHCSIALKWDSARLREKRECKNRPWHGLEPFTRQGTSWCRILVWNPIPCCPIHLADGDAGFRLKEIIEKVFPCPHCAVGHVAAAERPLCSQFRIPRPGGKASNESFL